MKKQFKLKFDEEFGEYYFQLTEHSDYIWTDSLLTNQDNNKIAITEYGYFIVDNIDYKNMLVYCTL